MSPNPLTTLLAERPSPCPACGHVLTSAPDRRCVECGVPLEATLAVSAPASGIVPAILVSAGLSATVGFERLIVYAANISAVVANLGAVPWPWLAVDAATLGSPLVAAVVFVRRDAIARLGRRGAIALAIVVALPFLINQLLLLRAYL